MSNENFTPAPQPTSAADLRAAHAEAEKIIQAEAAKSRAVASLPPGTAVARREDIETAPDTRGLSPGDAHRLNTAYFHDVADVLAAEARPGAQPANAAFITELQNARQAMGAKPSPTALQVWETQMSAAMTGWNGKLQSYPDWCRMVGAPLTAEQAANWQAATASTRAEIAAASIAPEDRAIGLVHQTEIPEADRHGYSLAAAGNVPLDAAVASMMLNMARALNLSQAHIDSALRAELKRAGRS